VVGWSTGRLVLQFDADASTVLVVVSEVAAVANSAVEVVCYYIDLVVSLAAVVSVVVLRVVADNMVPGFDFVVAHYRVGVDILAAFVVHILVAFGVESVAVVDDDIAMELIDEYQVQLRLRLVFASFS